MVEGYRVLKNRLIHDDVICPQDADAAHLAFWERIQQLEEENTRLEKAWSVMHKRCFEYEVTLGLRKENDK